MLVLSSRSEASPNVLFEALYLGVPVVSTACTENINSIVKNGVNGYVVPVDDVEVMLQAMLRVVKGKIDDVKMIYHLSTEKDWRDLFNI